MLRDASGSWRILAPGQRCVVSVVDVDGVVRDVWESRELLVEAPNWTRDGAALIVNGAGMLWRLALEDGGLEAVRIDGVPPVNNDHVLAPDGARVYVTANDGQIYCAPLAGGTAEQVTDAASGLLHFLHGVAPDGRTLAFVGLVIGPDGTRAAADIWTIGADGTGPRRLTHGPGLADGPEFSPDGAWIHFNTEAFDGHAQVARIRLDGSGMQQLTFDDHVNWFPHLSPDGAYGVYLRYPPGTVGHPADLPVDLVLVNAHDWSDPVVLVSLPGGQGTINVHSWAPDSRAFAFVSYPSDVPPPPEESSLA